MPIGSVSSQYPQSTQNRTRSQAITEIATFVGGGNQDAVKTRAGYAWDRAVTEFNNGCWIFNRVFQNITLASPVSSGGGSYANQEYTLSNDFKAPYRAMLVDSSSKTSESLSWVNFGEWRYFMPDTSSNTSVPLLYTARNVHEYGQIIVYPPLDTSNLTYPTLRLMYYRRIAKVSGNDNRLDVPVEVDEAIFQLAVANMISQEKSFQQARDALVRAKAMEAAVRAEYGGWPDPEYF